MRHKFRNHNYYKFLKLEIMVAILIPISLFLAVFAIMYVFLTTRSKERLALVEKGLNVDIFKDKTPKKTSPKYSLLKLGIFLASLAVGILVGYLLSTVINEEVAYFSMILLFGGAGLIVAHYITSSLASKEKTEKSE